MNQLNQILQLPERSLVNRKITKAFFKRNFDLTLSERKLLDDASLVQQIDWIASLKPEQVNVVAYLDSSSTFEEVQIVSVLTSEDEFEKVHQKLVDLIQKYLPYHVLLCVYNKNSFVINVCNKRISLKDSNERTTEKSLTTEVFAIIDLTDTQKNFLSNLVFERVDKTNLKTLYESYFKAVTALKAASITGEYSNRPIERSKQDLEGLELIKKFETEIISLQNQARKETQLNLQVKINTEVQYRRKEIETIKEKLKV